MSMTREEKRKLLIDLIVETKKTDPETGSFTEWLADFLVGYGVSFNPITREQVERVWRGEWVKRHKHRGGFRRVKGFDDMGEQHEVTIDERCEYDDLYCSKCGKQSPDNFLNFCGYCGAPMTDEAVEMVMERLEALRDEKG